MAGRLSDANRQVPGFELTALGLDAADLAQVEERGHPTAAALDRVIEFLGERLRP